MNLVLRWFDVFFLKVFILKFHSFQKSLLADCGYFIVQVVGTKQLFIELFSLFFCNNVVCTFRFWLTI
ncbi:hypothetical protein OXYTRIMIC_009 [Oxytricha trifallax]|uniref:Uncharacterized protein n=1 Tax=Oxytricha trifallax TaxID=1172189 RepID=A0A073HYU6_9SPIT|nr:hypothetical protein OXYTRIMIC_009 [Oxytricha trifallax]